MLHVGHHADDLAHPGVIVAHRYRREPGAMRLPIGSSFGKYCRASASLTMSTGGALNVSRSVKSLPRFTGMPIVLK